MRHLVVGLGVVLVFSAGQAKGDTITFTALNPTGSLFDSQATAISRNGWVVVGGTSAGKGEAFRWTAEDGMSDLGSLAGSTNGRRSYGVSDDGRVVVGGSPSAQPGEAFMWTQTNGMVGLGDLPGGTLWSQAYGASGDGSVIVGQGNTAIGGEAFRWTSSTGMVGLGDLPGGANYSYATGVSQNGKVIVGGSVSVHSGVNAEAFRWTAESGMVGIGDLPGGVFSSEAYDVSADGSIVAGVGQSSNGREAFLWTESAGMIGLGDLAGGSFNRGAIPFCTACASTLKRRSGRCRVARLDGFRLSWLPRGFFVSCSISQGGGSHGRCHGGWEGRAPGSVGRGNGRKVYERADDAHGRLEGQAHGKSRGA
ncbi:MAG: hypothetical protein FJ276_17680 [Planctomycetes bacterium]|nr:hypothetical protein [Planctomycetota bacterium]